MAKSIKHIVLVTDEVVHEDDWNAEHTIEDDTITEPMLVCVNEATDQYVLIWSAADGKLKWAELTLAQIPDLSSLYSAVGHGHAQLHNRSHSLVSTSDHASAVAVGKHFKADANGLPIQASNTDAEIAAAVAASHAAVTNRLAGITPTFWGFDTNPPYPNNITDGNWTTWSGEGVKTLAAPGTVGDILFDLGAPYPVLVIAQFNVRRDSGDGTLGVSLAQSDDGVTYVSLTPALVTGVTASATRGGAAMFVYARYLRIRTMASATTVSSVYHVNIASVMALQLV